MDTYAPRVPMLLVGTDARDVKFEELQSISDYLVNAFLLNSSLEPSFIPDHAASLAFFAVQGSGLEDATYLDDASVKSRVRKAVAELAPVESSDVDDAQLQQLLQCAHKLHENLGERRICESLGEIEMIVAEVLQASAAGAEANEKALMELLFRLQVVVKLRDGRFCIPPAPSSAGDRRWSSPVLSSLQVVGTAARIFVSAKPISKDVAITVQDLRSLGFMMPGTVSLLNALLTDSESPEARVMLETVEVIALAGNDDELVLRLCCSEGVYLSVKELPAVHSLEVTLHATSEDAAQAAGSASRLALDVVLQGVRIVLSRLAAPLSELQAQAVVEHKEEFVSAERAWERLAAKKRYMRASTEMVFLAELVEEHPYWLYGLAGQHPSVLF